MLDKSGTSSKRARPTGKKRTSINMAVAGKKKSKGGLDHEQIIMQFNQMRQESRSIMGKIGELEMEVNEHG